MLLRATPATEVKEPAMMSFPSGCTAVVRTSPAMVTLSASTSPGAAVARSGKNAGSRPAVSAMNQPCALNTKPARAMQGAVCVRGLDGKDGMFGC